MPGKVAEGAPERHGKGRPSLECSLRGTAAAGRARIGSRGGARRTRGSALSEHIPADWDMKPYFAGPDADDYLRFRDAVREDVARIGDAFTVLGPLAEENVEAFATELVALEAVSARSAHIGSYLGCIGAADARDERIKRETAGQASDRVELEKVLVGVRAAIRVASPELFARLIELPALRDVAHFVRRLRERAQYNMDVDLEALAAELGVDGISAFARLYDRVSGTLEFDLARPDGSSERVPVAMSRTLLEDPDPAVRRAALRGANAAWESVGESVAACLNAIAGTRLTLYRRRGVDHFLDPPLFDSAISRATLDAMWEAVESRIELPRAYLRRKAKLLGRERLGFQDLLAPLPVEDDERVPWPAAEERVVAAFDGFYPDLARFAEMAFEKRWVDHTPRLGKRPGGFCSTSHVIGQSRIFMTYNGAPGDVATLAHELGHAWHGWLMRDMRPWSRGYPMTLAETASTFAENIAVEAALEGAEGEALAFTLDARLQDAASYLLNILMRYRFECALYEERASGELGVPRLCELMVEAQRAVYGDALDEDELDPWFWASKLHFYISGLSFYNFPYTFGYLFSTGLFARALADGPAFLPAYEGLLRRTGNDVAEVIAAQSLDVDLTRPGFWHESLDWIEGHLPRFEAATATSA